VDKLWTSIGQVMDINWTSYGHQFGQVMDINWTSYGHQLDTLWTSIGQVMDINNTVQTFVVLPFLMKKSHCMKKCFAFEEHC
jgi:hypothetical protein